jgi:hypothetical protein
MDLRLFNYTVTKALVSFLYSKIRGGYLRHSYDFYVPETHIMYFIRRC